MLVGKKAPKFSAPAVVDGNEIVEDFSLEQYLGEKNVVFFFYPMDYTFVCPTELHAFQEKLEAFAERDTVVVACSTDTEQSHWGWLQMPRDEGGIEGVEYPIVADTSKTIALNYDVLAGDYTVSEETGRVDATGPMVAYRGLFLIDKEGIVRHEVVNDFPLGRSVDEALRMVDALEFYNEHGHVCPANWKEGEEGMEESHEGVAEYLGKTA